MQLSSSIQPVPFPGKGRATTPWSPEDGFPSASFLRQKIAAGETQEPFPYLPPECQEIFRREQKAGRLALPALGEKAILGKLWSLSLPELSALPGAAEGLEHRFARALQKNQNLTGALEETKTRRYPLSRLRRMALCGFLGLTKQECQSSPSYIKVLAMGEKGRQAWPFPASRVLCRSSPSPPREKPSRPFRRKGLCPAVEPVFKRPRRLFPGRIL